MNIALSFAPFIVFALLSGTVGALPALLAAALVSAALLARSRFAGASPKILELGSLILFAGLALYVGLTGAAPSAIAVKLSVDVGLFLIVVVSMAVGRPFTIQYAREEVPAEFWESPRFKRVNMVITAVWALAFLVIVLAEAALLAIPTLSPALGVPIVVAALVGAMLFTRWYPKARGGPPLPGTTAAER